MEKRYLALVDGRPPTPTGRVEAAINRDPSHRQKMAIVPTHKGRMAISEYRIVEDFPSTFPHGSQNPHRPHPSDQAAHGLP